MSDTNLFAQQESNRRRSVWLVAGFVLFFAWVGFGGDVALALLTRGASPAAYHHVVPVIGIITTLIAGGICWYSWQHGAERILWATGAWELIEPATPEQQQLVNVVEEMSIAAGLPRPKIWIVPDDDPNAFATGRDPATASIAVTEGLLKTLSRDELQGVVAHEMAHVQNLDTRLMTLLAAMVGAVALMSDGLGRMTRGGGRMLGGAAEKEGEGKGGNPLGIVILVLWLLTLVVAPIVSRLLAMAVSRKREYLADATGAWSFRVLPLRMKISSGSFRAAAAMAVALAFNPLNSPAADTNPPTRSEVETTNAQEVLRSYLQLQEQLHLTQLAVQENRKEAREAAVRTEEALATASEGANPAEAACAALMTALGACGNAKAKTLSFFCGCHYRSCTDRINSNRFFSKNVFFRSYSCCKMLRSKEWRSCKNDNINS